MASFTYTARDATGQLKSATLDATSRDDALSQLTRRAVASLVDDAR